MLWDHGIIVNVMLLVTPGRCFFLKKAHFISSIYLDSIAHRKFIIILSILNVTDENYLRNATGPQCFLFPKESLHTIDLTLPFRFTAHDFIYS